MNVVSVMNHEAMSMEATAFITREVRRKPDLLLGVASGVTPTRTYDRLAEIGRGDPSLLPHLRIFKIDEWGGLPMEDPATCEVYVRQKILHPWNIGNDRYEGWRSDPADPRAECDRIRLWLFENGPMDLCVLGVGTNGHLALIEPSDALHYNPHVANLAESSLRHPMLASANSPARYGLTIGIGDIFKSRKLLVLASGVGKAAVIDELLRRDSVSPRFPASFLRLHSDATLILDDAAGESRIDH